MANGFGSAVLPQIQRIFQGGTLAGLTDGQLLEQFAHHNDNAAFEALLVRARATRALRLPQPAPRPRRRRGRLSSNPPRPRPQSREIRLDEASLGPWIYSVAYRVAIRARANRGLRGQRESAVADLDPQAPREILTGTTLRRCSIKNSRSSPSGSAARSSSAISRA